MSATGPRYNESLFDQFQASQIQMCMCNMASLYQYDIALISNIISLILVSFGSFNGVSSQFSNMLLFAPVMHFDVIPTLRWL